MQLADLLDLSLLGRAAAKAIVYQRQDGSVAELTFADLDRRSDEVARQLDEAGLRRGDRLALLLPNCVEFIDFLLASMKLGIIVVPINVLYREREISHILGDSQPKLVVTNRSLAPLLSPGTTFWSIEELTPESPSSLSGSRRIRTLIDGDMPAAIVYTSGTTGLSKGAVLSHNNFAANTVNLLTCWRITHEDRYLAVLPLFHVHGLGNGILSWLVSGCLMRLEERFVADRAAAIFEEFRPTLFFGVPTIYIRLLELTDEVALRVGARTRLFVSGSAPLPAHILEAFRSKFGHTILERYGMSETLMNISNPYDGERRPGSVGLPLPGVLIKLIDAQGREVSDSEVGEVFIRGPNVFSGYWNQPNATTESFVDGWFRSGDLAERAEDGYYTLRGRRTELIISGGFNIYPREIEELLLEQTGVREVAVCGVPDERRGELPIAYLVADDPFDAIELEAICRRSLASFKVPRAFVRVAALPRTALGKVQKKLLPPWPVK